VSALFIKLGISKAFDTVSCPYLLSIMSYLGFGQRWLNWISSLWCRASSCYMVNGNPGKRVLHCRGVRQGDPLSPLLFLLAMEPLHRLFKCAQDVGLLRSVSRECDIFKISLYADDAALFISPSPQDVQVTNCIMHLFAQASGLSTNISKTQVFPIGCDQHNLDFLSQNNLAISSFPCTYLGLALHTRKLPRSLL
jgi:hypothetical protein